METFFKYLKKTLVGCTALVFAFIVIYTPQEYTQEVQAGAAGGGASEWTQLANFGKLFVTGASTLEGSISNGLLVAKEIGLDGIAWAALKQALAIMANDMIKWASRGFKGGPTFVTDLEEFLKREADAAIGEYIKGLGGIGSFLCDPFKLDITIALSQINLQAYNTRASCTLTEVVDNVDDFLSGGQGSFSRGGGWESWLEITSKPERNTYFGSLLTAQKELTEVKLAKESEERTKLGWGNGFFSLKTCNKVEGSVSKTDCAISTPGQLIQQALSNNLDSERQSLVAADEIDEFITSFFGAAVDGGLKVFASRVSGQSNDGGASIRATTIKRNLETAGRNLEQEGQARAEGIPATAQARIAQEDAEAAAVEVEVARVQLEDAELILARAIEEDQDSGSIRQKTRVVEDAEERLARATVEASEASEAAAAAAAVAAVGTNKADQERLAREEALDRVDVLAGGNGTTANDKPVADAEGDTSAENISAVEVDDSSWKHSTSDTARQCEFSCDADYYYDSDSNSCLTDLPRGNGECTGYVPTNGSAYGTETFAVTNDGSDLPWQYSASDTSRQCQFRCNPGYSYSGVSGRCILETNPTYTCTGSLPSNSSEHPAETSGLIEDITWQYSASDTPRQCQFRCNSDYTYNGSTGNCVPTIYSCTGSIPSNSSPY